MKRAHITYLLAVILTSVSVSAGAQSVEEIAQSVNVEKDFTPEIKKADKFYVKPVMDPAPVIDFSGLSYNIAYRSEPYVSGITPLSVPLYEQLSLGRLYHGYADVMVGAPLQSRANLYYTTTRMRDFILGAGLNHRGFYGNIKNDMGVKESGLDMNNAISLMMRYRVKRLEVKVDAMASHRLLDRYGYMAPAGVSFSEDEQKSIDDNMRQYYLKGFANFSAGTPESEKYDFNGAFRGFYSFISDKASCSEQVFQAGITMSSGLLKKRHRIFLDMEYMILMSNKNVTKTSPVALPGQDPYQYLHLDGTVFEPYSTFFIKPLYRYKYAGWDIEAGAKMTFGVGNTWYDKKTQSIIPVAKVSVSLLSGGLIPYLDIDGEYEYNTYYNLSEKNPYVRNGLTAPNTQNIRGHIGFRGYIASNVKYDIFGGYEMIKDRVMFVNYEYGNTFTSSLSDFNNIVAGVYVDYSINRMFGIEAMWKYTHYKNVSVEDGTGVIGLPDNEAFFKFRFDKDKKAGAYLRVDFQSKREGLAKFADRTTLISNSIAPAADVSVGGYYMLTKRFGINAEVNNIFNQKLYQYNFYRGVGINGMIGASYKF